jgi:hypothetical protein
MKHKSDREKLYGSLTKRSTVKVEIPFNPILLSALGYYNPLKPEDKPDLREVENLREILKSYGV